MFLYYNNFGLTIYLCFWIAVIGAVIGSFIGCVSSRFAVGESTVRGRSKCLECGHDLGFLDLVPILSFIFLKGKCRYCGKKIPRFDFVCEVSCALLFVFVFLSMASILTWQLPKMLMLSTVLLAIIFMDYMAHKISNKALLLLFMLWLLYGVFTCPMDITEGAEVYFSRLAFALGLKAVALSIIIPLALFILSLVMNKLTGWEMKREDDIKLLIVLSLYLSYRQMLIALIVACILGLIVEVVMKVKKSPVVPFGSLLGGLLKRQAFFFRSRLSLTTVMPPQTMPPDAHTAPHSRKIPGPAELPDLARHCRKLGLYCFPVTACFWTAIL